MCGGGCACPVCVGGYVVCVCEEEVWGPCVCGVGVHVVCVGCAQEGGVHTVCVWFGVCLHTVCVGCARHVCMCVEGGCATPCVCGMCVVCLSVCVCVVYVSVCVGV